MYKLKNMVKRSTAFTAAVVMLTGVGSTALPAVTSADALNPLTERSLTLSSSSPGWSYTDGSGNALFAPPGSGPNGQKTGETFAFRVSTDSSGAGPAIKAFTMQYCTAPAGNCTSPGNVGTADPDNQESNLDVVTSSPAEWNGTTGFFEVRVADDAITGDIADSTQSTGWEMTTATKVTSGTPTEKNFITLTQTNGTPTDLKPAAGTKLWVIFHASATNYITNPGKGAFFVKLNDYSSDGTVPEEIDPLDPAAQIIDGGVTVANVMNDSIWITTKVLETMAFSVGVENPDNVELTGLDTHGACDPIVNNGNTRIDLGDPNAEFSLATNYAYDALSYWRLSTNSSAGASVYYSGATLNNTVGDKVQEIGSSSLDSGAQTALSYVPGGVKPHYGMEQFGLGLDSSVDAALDTAHGAVAGDIAPLVPTTDYANATGTVHEATWSDNTAKFSFTEQSIYSPELIATESDEVIDCSTGKMRYIANIAPSTPAGVYTTKINYIAAPQY